MTVADSEIDFYVIAIPERLAHLMLCNLRSSVLSNSTFFLDVKHTPSHVASFREAVYSSLVDLERRVQPRLLSTNKRNGYDEMDGSTSASR